ncbi:hypothetical protein [Octadecabacter ascidiaceicola]|uniref:Uncharacterized protein n=1 Tax=Octadecabacter ascidiaceicola TaxID=1655543 RepID=A0A238KN93_9RHOB|nr:hypothetical protein [Octadecabacter ascidiaceicola]SMX44178.1 hypothetical protein OCA8868_03082 [Octadecabacter ascidiaceicola]
MPFAHKNEKYFLPVGCSHKKPCNARAQDCSWRTDFTSIDTFELLFFCRPLSAELSRVEGTLSENDASNIQTAQAKGFAVARQSENAVTEALKMLAAHAGGRSDEPRMAFGRLYADYTPTIRRLYADLSTLYLNRQEFEPFHQLLCDSILSVWPIGTWETVFGVCQQERKLHTIHTAAKETGIGAFLLEQFLVHAGTLDRLRDVH